jgi:branched-chain amino acid transport system ATP-binding protein
VLENVMIGFQRNEHCSVPAALLGFPSARRETARVRKSALDLLGRFGMTRYSMHPAGALSYGHQRRVEMMRALAASPRLLLLDEPVAGMNDVRRTSSAPSFSTSPAAALRCSSSSTTCASS